MRFCTKSYHPASGPIAKSSEGFTPGLNAGLKFEGSTSGDGRVFDLSSGVGYNFSRHFGVDLGSPYYFVGSPSSVKQKDPQAVSANGFGSVGADLKWNFSGDLLNYDPTIHFTAPTGDTKKGFSTGRAIWNWANHLEHAFSIFTPFLDLRVGNTVSDIKYFHRPFITFGRGADKRYRSQEEQENEEHFSG
jgi:hypothetical protein